MGVSQLSERWSQCREQASRLRMIAVDEDDPVSAGQFAAQIREAANAVLAEVEAMSRTVLRNRGRGAGTDTFLWVRVTRLALAADRAVNAARSGDFAAARSELRHFETLTSAIATVQDAVYGRERESVRGTFGLAARPNDSAPAASAAKACT
jgi:hypothetical protein